MPNISSFAYNATQRAQSVDNPNSRLSTDKYNNQLDKLLNKPNLPSQVRSVVAALSEQINPVDPGTPDTPTQPTNEYGPLTLITVGASGAPDGTAWLTGPASPSVVPVTDNNGDPVILSDGRPLYMSAGGNGGSVGTQ